MEKNQKEDFFGKKKKTNSVKYSTQAGALDNVAFENFLHAERRLGVCPFLLFPASFPASWRQ